MWWQLLRTACSRSIQAPLSSFCKTSLLEGMNTETWNTLESTARLGSTSEYLQKTWWPSQRQPKQRYPYSVELKHKYLCAVATCNFMPVSFYIISHYIYISRYVYTYIYIHYYIYVAMIESEPSVKSITLWRGKVRWNVPKGLTVLASEPKRLCIYIRIKVCPTPCTNNFCVLLHTFAPCYARPCERF